MRVQRFSHMSFNRGRFEDDHHPADSINPNRGMGARWRDVYRARRREELLDSYSDPPNQSVLYAPTFVISGERVAHLDHLDVPLDRDAEAVAIGRLVFEPPPLEGEEAKAFMKEWKKQRAAMHAERRRKLDQAKLDQERLDEEDRQRIRAELRAMPVPPVLAERLRRRNEGRP